MQNELFVALDKKIESTKTMMEQLPAERTPEIDLLNKSLQSRLDDLKHEKKRIQELRNHENITVVLNGQGVRGNAVSVKVLSIVLRRFQDLADSIANALANEPAEHGKIPSSILNQSELFFKRCFDGSFGMEVEGPHQKQMSFERPLITYTITRLFDLLSSGNDADSIVESASGLGARAFKRYREWLQCIVEQQIDVDINWRSAYAGNYSWLTRHTSVPSILDTLEKIKEKTDDIVEEMGTITGINIRKETFEAQNECGELISGRSRHDLLLKSRNLIGQKTKLLLVRTTLRNTISGKEKVSWILSDVISG